MAGAHALTQLAAGPIDLSKPGSFVHWSIFTVSVANLVLIAVMVVIFGAALLIPFPRATVREAPRTADGMIRARGRRGEPAAGIELPDDDDRGMWTAALRRRALRLLPPGKLLPDRQPAYVASWIYVFGVATLAALGIAIVSGFAIALGGPDWWHTNPVGHFFNSLHLWSVELFMAFMVIHLWGKFWMAAWRGRRALTWITGVVAFVASVVECFTGYLSQQNFDSQWISTNGKDAINAVGLGAFFNLMNFGQMLLWHVVLIPIVLVAIVGAHILLVRVRGVSHPLPARPSRGRAAAAGGRGGRRRATWRGPTRRYDIVKEATIATVDRPGARGVAGRPAVLARRAAGHRRQLGQGGTGRLHGHCRLRAGRHQRDRHVRAALQPRQPAAVQRTVSPGRRRPASRQPINAGADLRARPAVQDAPTDPPLAAALDRLQGGRRRPAAGLGPRPT